MKIGYSFTNESISFDDFGNICDEYGDPIKIKKLNTRKLSKYGKEAIKILKDVYEEIKQNLDNEYYKMVSGLKHDLEEDEDGYETAVAGVTIYNKLTDYEIELEVVCEPSESYSNGICSGVYLIGEDLDGEYYDFIKITPTKLFKLMPYLKDFKAYVTKQIYKKVKSNISLNMSFQKFTKTFNKDIMEWLENGDDLDDIAGGIEGLIEE